MGGMKEYQKGYDAGYTTGPSRMPRTFAEAVGYSAGQARRERERRPRQEAGGGGGGGGEAGGIGPLGLVVLVVAAASLVGLVLMALGVSVFKAIYPAAGVVGLLLTPRVRKGLGVLTPVYVGAMIGLLVGCVELAIASPELNVYNLRMFIVAGGIVGGVAIPILAMRKK